MRTRVKVCCITSPDTLELAVRRGADAIGLVGPMPSGTGIIDLDTARELAARTPPGVASFLLSCAVDATTLVEQVQKVRPTAVQLVDRVEPRVYGALRAAAPWLKLVQVVHVMDEAALAEADSIAPAVDAVLLDSGSRAGPVLELGGTGRTHDWRLSRRIVESLPKPVFLAGGLTPANVGAAIDAVHPFGVDLCTGLRTAGRLDPVKLDAFMTEVERHRARCPRQGGRP